MLLNSIAAAVTPWADLNAPQTASGSNTLSWDISSSGLSWTSPESLIWTVDVSQFDASKTYALLCIDDSKYYGLSSVYIKNGTLYLQSYASGATVASAKLDTIYTSQTTQTLTFVWNRNSSGNLSLQTYADYNFTTATSNIKLTAADTYSSASFTSLDFGYSNGTLTQGSNNTNYPTDSAAWSLLDAGYTANAVASAADLKAYGLTKPFISKRQDGTSLGRVTFIGDSITHGIDDQSYRWQFFKILTDNGIESEIVGPRNGYSTNTTANTSDAGSTYGEATFANVHLAHAGGCTRNIIAGGTCRDDFTSRVGVNYGGWSSSETGAAYNSDSWFCMIGTNDILSDTGQGSGYPTTSYCNRMETLLGGTVTFDGNTSTKIGDYNWSKGDDWGNLGTIISDVCTKGDTFYMLSVIPWGTHNHNDDSDHLAVKEYNRNLKTWCESYTEAADGITVKYVDVTRGLVDVTGGQIDGKITAGNPNGICFYAPNSFFNKPSDRLHPNEQGSLIMAGNLAQELEIGGRTAGLERQGTEGWASANVGTVEAGAGTLLLGKNAFTMTDGYTVDLSAVFGNGATDGWLSIDNALSITLGDGTNSGTLNLSEGYIMWGGDVLFCSDNSALAEEGNLRIAWHNGNEADNVLQGYYVWLGDMLIGQGLNSNSQSLGINGILLSANGANGTVSALTWTDTAYAPTLPTGWLSSEENAYITTQDTATATGFNEYVFQHNLAKMADADRNNSATGSNIDYTGITPTVSFTGGNTDTSHLVKSSNKGDSKFILGTTNQWISITNTTPDNDVSVKLTGAAGGTIFGTFKQANAQALTLEIESGASVADGLYNGHTAAIAGSYGGGKAKEFNVYVNGGTVNGDIVGGSINGTGKIENANIIINSGTVKNIIGGAKIANALVDNANIRVNGGVVNGDITAGGAAGAGAVATASVTITGGKINGNITKGTAQNSQITVEGTKAYIGGTIEADKVTLKNIETSGYCDGFDRYAGTITTPVLNLENIQTELVLRAEELLHLSVTGNSHTGLGLGENTSLESLTLGAGSTFSAWKERNGATDASNESTITIGALTAGANATLNANLVFTEASILTLDGTLAMGSTIELATGMSLTLSAEMLRDLYGGTIVNLFTGVDTLALDGETIDSGTVLAENIFDGLSSDYSYNLRYTTDGTVSLSTIPEPTTATLSMLALAALAARRRRRV